MLILFDIDGTLLLSDGAGVRAMTAAGKTVVGPDFTLAGIEVAGRLDPLIWADAAAALGFDGADARHDEFRSVYARLLGEHFRTTGAARALPGVQALVARLRDLEGVTIGLLTGNYPETGRLKLEAAGLDPNAFAVAAWGCDGRSRRDLPHVAITRYRERTGRAIDPANVIIIGDTPHDIDCAKAAACKVIGVATGPSFAAEDLRAHDPDLLVKDLSDTEGLVRWMLGAASRPGVAIS
jgi:phosphoglycolate phosphatase-like HAD superfamily hydrolase